MESLLAVKIPEITEYLEKNFDHVERIQKYRIVNNKDKKTGKIATYREYLVHCDEGEYEAVLIFKTKDGRYELYITRLVVYRRAQSHYFIYKVSNEENKELVFVYLKKAND